MWSRSIGPASAGTGTTTVPDRRPATTAITVSSVGVPHTATVPAPSNRAASASARPASPSHEVATAVDRHGVGRVPEHPVQRRQHAHGPHRTDRTGFDAPPTGPS